MLFVNIALWKHRAFREGNGKKSDSNVGKKSWPFMVRQIAKGDATISLCLPSVTNWTCNYANSVSV